MMDLRFQGDLPPWPGLLLALTLALGAALIYWREVRRQPERLSKTLPLLRGLTVFLLLLMLVGPVLHATHIVPLASKVLVFVDASQSMAVTDEHLEPLRKLRVMRSLGLLGESAFPDSGKDDAQTAAEAKRLIGSDRSAQAAAAKFDAMTRWERVQAILLGRAPGLIQKLTQEQGSRVDVYALASAETPRIWWSEQASVRALPYQPQASSTDLATGLQARTEAQDADEPAIAAILLSDGQHNAGPSPLRVAQLLGHRKMPIFAIALGATAAPPDLAVLEADAPDAVYIDDRVKGRIVLQDTMPPGRHFTLKIETAAAGASAGEARLLWEKSLTTDGSGVRRIDFDFAIAAAAQAEIGRLAGRGIEAMSLPVAMSVSATPLEEEKNKENNRADLMVRAVRSKRKVLLIDGRPRWEFRYLRNLFERDPQWEVNSLVSGVDRRNSIWLRGEGAGTFPKDKETLLSYDLVILGEVPPQLLSQQEIQWLRDFVGDRGGGMVLIDGPRAALRLYVGTPLGVLLPIEWLAREPGLGPWRLRLTQRSGAAGPLTLASDAHESARLWETLPGPHTIAAANALPGAETLLEAVAPGRRTLPAVVTRRYGAGRVWYTAFDESWRWRYEVEDYHFRRYWNQLANWVMEQPYAVRDRYVALDVGALSLRAGDAAQIRARLRDERGRPLLNAQAQAVIYQDGRKFAALPLEAQENSGGRMHGQSGPLPPGRYEVAVEVKELPAEEMKARVAFTVRGQQGGELTSLACNEELLRQMAEGSGGKFFREEDAGQMPDSLSTLARVRTLESDYPLWHQWPWFIAIAMLLTVEWLLRKKIGMV